jgi:hypothetical protein
MSYQKILDHLEKLKKDGMDLDVPNEEIELLRHIIRKVEDIRDEKKAIEKYTEKPVYAHRQMAEMISRTRSWILHNPADPLPYLPMIWREDISQEENEKAMYETLPPYKVSSQFKEGYSIYGFAIGKYVIDIEAKSEQEAFKLLIDEFWNFIDENSKVEMLGKVTSPRPS